MLTTKKGFTLLELLIVMAVVSSLAGIVLVTYPAARKRARDAQRKSDLKQYQTALEAYANKNNDLYPGAVDGNMAIQCGTLGLAVCQDDPIGTNPYRYQSNAGGTQYVVWGQLEEVDAVGSNQYFVLCSSGASGVMTTGIPPSDGNCPIL